MDIGKNMDQITGRKKAFYEDQKSKRECRLSEEIDEEFEEEKQELLEKEREKEEQLSQEISFIMEDDVESEVLDDSMNSVILKSSLNCSGLPRNTKEYSDKNVHTETVYQERPKIRKIRDCRNAAKTTCVNLSVKCNMSTEMSRVAVQTVCKDLYDYNNFLSKDEAIERDPSLSEYKQDNPPSNKRQKLDLPKKQVPKSLNEYKPYENVLATAKTII